MGMGTSTSLDPSSNLISVEQLKSAVKRLGIWRASHQVNSAPYVSRHGCEAFGGFTMEASQSAIISPQSAFGQKRKFARSAIWRLTFYAAPGKGSFEPSIDPLTHLTWDEPAPPIFQHVIETHASSKVCFRYPCSIHTQLQGLPQGLMLSLA